MNVPANFKGSGLRIYSLAAIQPYFFFISISLSKDWICKAFFIDLAPVVLELQFFLSENLNILTSIKKKNKSHTWFSWLQREKTEARLELKRGNSVSRHPWRMGKEKPDT